MTEEQKPKRKRQKPGDVHYVNNKEFSKALDEYSRDCRARIERGDERPVMSNYLGECVMKMAYRLSLTPRFRGYTYRDEMVQNGILAAVRYMHKFNGDKFNNGFAYVTQILFSHFIATIKSEKKKYETNMRLIQEAEATNIANPELSEVANEHARSIADQKLAQIEENKAEKGKGGFQLRTGYTQKARDAYEGGTPMERD